MALGAGSALSFIMFWLMHINLALKQYQTEIIQRFNLAVTANFLPGLDTGQPLTPMQFTSAEELDGYFLTHVNYMLSGAAHTVKNKSNFHQFNQIFPYVELVKVMGAKKDCGSPVSNVVSNNTMASKGLDVNNETYQR